MYACTYVCIHTYICMCVYTHIYIYIYFCYHYKQAPAVQEARPQRGARLIHYVIIIIIPNVLPLLLSTLCFISSCIIVSVSVSIGIGIGVSILYSASYTLLY